jgi:hypothetical protein
MYYVNFIKHLWGLDDLLKHGMKHQQMNFYYEILVISNR